MQKLLFTTKNTWGQVTSLIGMIVNLRAVPAKNLAPVGWIHLVCFWNATVDFTRC
jgi:hypothetical protein